MRITSNIVPKFWRDNKVRAMDNEEKLLFLYVLTCYHMNSFGFAYLPINFMSAELKWDISTTEQAVRSLCDKGVIKYDFKNDVILINNYIKYNIVADSYDDFEKEFNDTTSMMPETPLVVDFMLSFHEHVFKNMESDWAENINDKLDKIEFVKRGIAMSKEEKVAPSKNIGNNIKGNIKKDSEIPIETDNLEKPKRGRKKSVKTELDEEWQKHIDDIFNEIWEIYPRRMNDVKTRKAFDKLVKKRECSPEELLEAVKNYIRTIKRKKIEEEHIRLSENFFDKDNYIPYLPKNFHEDMEANDYLKDVNPIKKDERTEYATYEDLNANPLNSETGENLESIPNNYNNIETDNKETGVDNIPVPETPFMNDGNDGWDMDGNDSIAPLKNGSFVNNYPNSSNVNANNNIHSNINSSSTMPTPPINFEENPF